MTISEHWRRQERIGGGGFGKIWLEKCIKWGRPGVLGQNGAMGAVKQIDLDTRLAPVNYHRKLETIATFSRTRVGVPNKRLLEKIQIEVV